MICQDVDSHSRESYYFYRGTTRGWEGNPCLQQLEITCTTTDPLVATLFALNCLRHGEGIVQMAPRDRVGSLVGPGNHFDDLESAVNLRINPAEFTRCVTMTLHAHEAREILLEMGFPAIPYLINDNEALDDTLEETRLRNERLSAEQVDEFNRHVHQRGP